MAKPCHYPSFHVAWPQRNRWDLSWHPKRNIRRLWQSKRGITQQIYAWRLLGECHFEMGVADSDVNA